MKQDILIEDFERIDSDLVPFKEFKNSTFLITGATGLIGSLLIKYLLYHNRKKNLNIRIVALVRNIDKARKILELENEEVCVELKQQDMCLPMKDIDKSVDYIIHAAANTASRDMIQYPVDNIKTAVNGTMSMLDFAKENAIKGMVYISSMEVYGKFEHSEIRIKEKELGYIDLSAARSCYPEGKRICECMCSAYASQYGVNVVIARLAQTFGAGILKGENRVFAQFAKSVIAGKDIVLRTKGLSEGNYVYTADAIEAILLLLVKGRSGEAYNVANEESHMTIKEMAELVAVQVSHNNIKVRYDIPSDIESLGYAPDTKLYLSSEKLRQLGWLPKVDLVESYKRMIAYMETHNIQ